MKGKITFTIVTALMAYARFRELISMDTFFICVVIYSGLDMLANKISKE